MKDFKEMNTSDVYHNLDVGNNRRGQQPPLSEGEKDARLAAMQTQGRKGCHSPRINLALTPENHEFIRVMAKATGKTMTQFINAIIAAYKREHPDFMESANEFLNKVNSGSFVKLLDPKE